VVLVLGKQGKSGIICVFLFKFRCKILLHFVRHFISFRVKNFENVSQFFWGDGTTEGKAGPVPCAPWVRPCVEGFSQLSGAALEEGEC